MDWVDLREPHHLLSNSQAEKWDFESLMGCNYRIFGYIPTPFGENSRPSPTTIQFSGRELLGGMASTPFLSNKPRESATPPAPESHPGAPVFPEAIRHRLRLSWSRALPACRQGSLAIKPGDQSLWPARSRQGQAPRSPCRLHLPGNLQAGDKDERRTPGSGEIRRHGGLSR